jgi:hypothetical protein
METANVDDGADFSALVAMIACQVMLVLMVLA